MKEVKFIPGDLVTNHHDTVLRIVDMVAGFLYTEYQDGSPGLYISRKDVVPIPLTSEILEKNGWKTQNGWYYYLDVRKGFISCIDIDFEHKSDNGKLLVKVNNENLLEIEFVHQLQHLLFGLGLPMDLKV